MAPVTRSRRRKDSIPLVLVLNDPNRSRPASDLPLPQPEDSATPAASPSNPRKQTPTAEGTDKLTNSAVNQPPPPPEDKPANPAAADSESDSGDDDEAPEVVSLDTGREAARKAQDEAKRAVEAGNSQADATRKKRKAREAKLKEQKEEANERKKKRRKVNPEDEEEEVVDNSRALTIAEKSTEPLADEANAANSSSPSPPPPPPPAEQQFGKPNPPTLLPETLLAQVAATKRHFRHHRDQPDSNPEPEQKKQITNTGIGGRNAERNRRKKQRQKLNRTLKKGPVSVKVLKDDTKSRKILPPPTTKVVGSIKDSWLFGRKAGGAMRRHVVTGFVRK
ncbi:hypothetical protein C7212DRAFT_356373 [Tuber magnatum]|uniref:Uncharacterized protein n=1 Tax=Tuber magnatum TaxID=42249 RepID=A0A317SYR3_9PEZI|nr:hypothetical protein C7212DRAFT_356373 [Tuber magnatum]